MSAVTQAKRIVVKVGTSTLTYENGKMNLRRIERLCRVLSDLKNSGREIILVTSGAIGVGVGKLGLSSRPKETAARQAVAAVGQCELMFIYDKFFGEYNLTVAQVLLTADVLTDEHSRKNTENTFLSLLKMGAVPIVNENDTVAVDELVGAHIGDNDTLSAVVAALVQADLLILLSDIDGLYTDDPRKNKEAEFISEVRHLDERIRKMAKASTGSSIGTGGMATKLNAAEIATSCGCDMVIANSKDFHVIHRIMNGLDRGTIFLADSARKIELADFLSKL